MIRTVGIVLCLAGMAAVFALLVWAGISSLWPEERVRAERRRPRKGT